MTTWFSEHLPIPGYEPIRVLGRNGAIVYLARSVRLDKLAALQVWPKRALPGNAAALTGLAHPNVLEMFDVGEVGEHSYFAFEYVEVDTLAQRLRMGPLGDVEARESAIAIATALQFARETGATVANLTPGDVLLTEPLKVFLHPAPIVETRPDFAPPEGHAAPLGGVNEAVGVYRVGALLYAMLTTQPPIPAKVARRRWHEHLAEYVPVSPRQINPSVSEKLEAVCLKCLERAPTDRYGSLRETIEALAVSE
ncbi:MAG TPA: hypothetical protein VFO58_21155 [Vicinamibacterales bacterium]|nr:hypothetical protein [Vicinamibacterales bacterium]